MNNTRMAKFTKQICDRISTRTTRNNTRGTMCAFCNTLPSIVMTGGAFAIVGFISYICINAGLGGLNFIHKAVQLWIECSDTRAREYFRVNLFLLSHKAQYHKFGWTKFYSCRVRKVRRASFRGWGEVCHIYYLPRPKMHQRAHLDSVGPPTVSSLMVLTVY